MRWMVALLALAACEEDKPDPTDGTEPCPTDSWFVDDDRDGFGVGPLVEGCADDRPLAAADVDGDCDDSDADVFPDAPELCNGIDDDCDDGIDDEDPD
ncbi:MAG: MopE-related protein, partial [Myxococcota bacterium]